ncbi:hypothetical protein HYX12_01360 [Candidatus Woesearchaeota archaeon]|nr:hypothetical protein [Candidatus Woesearchaeota archaeon]
MKKEILVLLLVFGLLVVGCAQQAQVEEGVEEVPDEEEGSEGALAGQAVSSTTTPISCVDFDNTTEYRDGKNPLVASYVTYTYDYTVRGVTKRNSINYPDMCHTTPGYVKEYFCNPAGKTYSIRNLKCNSPSNGTCRNGACMVNSICGNDVIEGTEQCDTTNLAGATCPEGTTGTPTCTASCTLDTSLCLTPFCYYLDRDGNQLPTGTRLIDIYEGGNRVYYGIVTEEGTFLPECKNSGAGVGYGTIGQVGGYTCGGSSSSASGPGVAKSSVVTAIYGCPIGISCQNGACVNLCGNGLVDVGEECEGNELSGAVCPVSTTGTPTCTASCTLNTSSCVAAPSCTEGSVQTTCQGTAWVNQTCTGGSWVEEGGRTENEQVYTCDGNFLVNSTCQDSVLTESRRINCATQSSYYTLAPKNCSANSYNGYINCQDTCTENEVVTICSQYSTSKSEYKCISGALAYQRYYNGACPTGTTCQTLSTGAKVCK